MIGNDRYRILAVYDKYDYKWMLTQEKLCRQETFQQINCQLIESRVMYDELVKAYKNHEVGEDMKIEDVYSVVDAHEVLCVNEPIIHI